TPAQTDTAVAPIPVVVETEDDLMVSRGSLASVVAVDPSWDKFFLPAAGFSALEAPTPGPTAWQSTTETQAGTTQIQLEPELGLDALPTLLHEKSQKQYRVTKAEGSLVTIEPSLETDIGERDIFSRSATFDPFAPVERNRQEHALYIGSESVLNLPTDAEI